MRTKVRPALEAALAKVQSQKFHKWRNQRSGGGLRVEMETKRPTKANIRTNKSFTSNETCN